MSDVFISYAREENHRAAQLAQVLQDRGFSVWWDRQIAAGQSWANVIEQQLDKSRCVVLLVSKTSIASAWVLDEAAYALDAGKLLPVLLEDVQVPFRMRSITPAVLTNWKGETDHPELARLIAAISQYVGPHDLRDFRRGSSMVDRDSAFQKMCKWLARRLRR